MNIDVDKLREFVTKSTLSGLIPSAIFKIKDNRISCKIRDTNNTLVVLSDSKLETDGEVELCIKDTKLLLSVLGIYSGKVELHKSENVLSIVNNDRQVDVILTSEEFVENNLTKELTLEWENNHKISVEILKNSVRNMGILNSRNVEFEVKNKELTITAGENNFDKITEKMKLDEVDCKVQYGEQFANVVNSLSDDVEISFKKDFPCRITDKKDGNEFVYVIAPIVEQN
jgi:hypothetical protein